jgi:hypothetical protein
MVKGPDQVCFTYVYEKTFGGRYVKICVKIVQLSQCRIGQIQYFDQNSILKDILLSGIGNNFVERDETRRLVSHLCILDFVKENMKLEDF